MFVMLLCLVYAALLSPAGEGLIFWLLWLLCLFCFCHFPTWCPGSGVVLDCIDSLSLPPFLIHYIVLVCHPEIIVK